MGDFPGHALAGSFFFIMGLWWSTKSILMHVCKKQKRACFLGSKALFHRSEILEGMVIVGMVLTGIVCLQSAATSKEGQWVRILRWHHLTIYLFYGLCGVVNILCFTITSLPVSLTKLMLSNAFFADAFTLYNHTHGREMVDIFVHQLLTFATILAGLVAFIEFLTRSKVTLVLLRSSLIMLQGSWLWQVSWGLQVLYLCLLRIKNKLLFLFGGALCCKSHIPCDVKPLENKKIKKKSIAGCSNSTCSLSYLRSRDREDYD
uniref:Transmembrane protein 45A n=2 Tax=Castor canadensis TaxID=51338 RepID=A0A8C0WCD8_CASCN